MRICILFGFTLQVVLKTEIRTGLPQLPHTYLLDVISRLVMEGAPLFATESDGDPQPLLHVGDVLGEINAEMVLISGALHDTAHLAIELNLAPDDTAGPTEAVEIARRAIRGFVREYNSGKPEAVERILIGEPTELFRYERQTVGP